MANPHPTGAAPAGQVADCQRPHALRQVLRELVADGASAKATVTSNESRVVSTSDGVQQRVWWVSLDVDDGNPYVSVFLVQVDAMTGEATIIGKG